MVFGEEIGNYSLGFIREFVTLCHHRILFRSWLEALKHSAFEVCRLDFSGFVQSLVIILNVSLEFTG